MELGDDVAALVCRCIQSQIDSSDGKDDVSAPSSLTESCTQTSIIVFTVAIPVAFVGALLISVIRTRRSEGQIRLEEGESPSPAEN